ncbi:MAG: response regulator [Candidatus Omnitrophica bacterium]|nr:response regulator [Candidatus Omnitrophota bacterium]MDD5079224.1 response regulator [Candidatus Omnitrophota bacterium]
MPRLMIVDDEDDVREFAANFFRKRKIEVTTAGTGEDAIKKAQADKPDLILMDIRMSGIDGIQALEAIKKINPSVKVVMVTGTKPDENETAKKCLELGACGYVHKPLRLDELETIVMTNLK